MADKLDNVFETIIDAEDLEKIKNIGLHFHHDFYKEINDFYVTATEYLGKNKKPKYKTLFLHKLIMDINPDNQEIYIDHINHNTMDNRKENLRSCSNKQNSSHRRGINKNNKTGHRNVCFYNDWYLVQLQVNGKNKLILKNKRL